MDDYHDYDVDIVQRPKRKEAMPAATERPSQDPNDFLMGGGIASASFLHIGAEIAGIICDPTPFLQQQRDYTTGEPKVWDDGNPMMHLVVTLQTDEQDDKIEDDDGRRRIYVKSNMKKAVAEAVRRAKAKALEVGGKLTVAYTNNGEPTKKGAQAPKLYIATYTPPSQTFLDKSEPDDANAFMDNGAPAKRLIFDTFIVAAEYAAQHTNGKMTKQDLAKELKAGGFATWDAKNCSPFVIAAVESFVPF